jgi:hypothetical protein
LYCESIIQALSHSAIEFVVYRKDGRLFSKYNLMKFIEYTIRMFAVKPVSEGFYLIIVKVKKMSPQSVQAQMPV